MPSTQAVSICEVQRPRIVVSCGVPPIILGQKRFGSRLPVAADIGYSSAVSLRQIATQQAEHDGHSRADNHEPHSGHDLSPEVGDKEDDNACVHQDGQQQSPIFVRHVSTSAEKGNASMSLLLLHQMAIGFAVAIDAFGVQSHAAITGVPPDVSSSGVSSARSRDDIRQDLLLPMQWQHC